MISEPRRPWYRRVFTCESRQVSILWMFAALALGYVFIQVFSLYGVDSLLDHPMCYFDIGYPEAPRARNLVFASVGDDSNPRWWNFHKGNGFDLMLVYYGSEKNRFRDLATHYCVHKGGKFENLQMVYRHMQGSLQSRYDAVFVVDDDIMIEGYRINELFRIREEFDISVLQPAFDLAGKVSHPITMQQPGMKLRFTNFIEMTAPLFKMSELVKFLDVFDPRLKGFGADWWFLNVVGGPDDLVGKVAVVDAVPCVNPHDEVKAHGRQISKLQSNTVRRLIYYEMQRLHNIVEWEQVEYETVWLDGAAPRPSGLSAMNDGRAAFEATYGSSD